MPHVAARRLLPVAMLAAALLAACGKPIVVHAWGEGDRAALPDVRIYRHVFSFFGLFPGKKFVTTGPDGSTEVMVGSANTNLTMLRAGYEPVLFGVFEERSQAIAPDKGGYDHVIWYDEIRSAPRNGYDVSFRPVRRVPLALVVTDRDTAQPIRDAEVFGATFLYLPQPGVEADWGFPPLQTPRTDATGRATLDQVSGFRNRVTVRVKGYQDGTLSFDGRTIAGPRSVDMPLRPLRMKQVDFLVIDGKSKQPIAGAEVRLGESRDGLPPNPNGWTKVTDDKGRTGRMPVPDMEPFLVGVKAKGYAEWRGAPVWRALDDGGTKKLELVRD